MLSASFSSLVRENIHSWSQMAKCMGPTWSPPGSRRSRWAPCWPHEPYYQGCNNITTAYSHAPPWYLRMLPCWLRRLFGFSQARAWVINQQNYSTPTLNVRQKSHALRPMLNVNQHTAYTLTQSHRPNRHETDKKHKIVNESASCRPPMR